MAGFVKLMSNEDMPDSSPFKAFQLISLPDGGKVEFKRNEQGLDTCIIHSPEHDPEEYLMHGNVYVLSDAGKTIASRATNVPCSLEPSQELNDEDVATAALTALGFDNVVDALTRASQKNPLVVQASGEFLANMLKGGNADAIKAVQYASEFLKA
jgi:hypothetical protein